MSSLNCLNNNNMSLLTARTPDKTPKLSGGNAMPTQTTVTTTLPTTETRNTAPNTTVNNNTNNQQTQITQLLFQLMTQLVNSMQGGTSQVDMTQINQLLGTLGTLTGGTNTQTFVAGNLAPTGGNAGPQGPAGQVGPQGPQGEKGDKGDQGIQGEKGEKGDKGDKGEQGLQGEKGVQGEKGDKGDQGIQGAKGEKGDKGDTGAAGKDGQNAYQLWLSQGNKGTEQQFLLSLVGENGTDGKDGVDGKSAYQIWIGLGNQGTQQDFLAAMTGEKGADGADGKSAYQTWLGLGNKGTEQQFITSLIGAAGKDGADGVDGQSAYQIWLGQGNKGSEADFLAAIQGAKGDQGAQGAKGEKGDTGAQGAKGEKGDTGAQGAKGEKGETGAAGQSAYQLWLADGNKGTEQQFLLSLVGERGANGKDGADGQSAYQIWLGMGNKGSEADFLAAIQGAQGAQGEKGDTGAQGAKGDKGDTGAQGAKGDTGAQGAQGEKGDKGDKGDVGEAGQGFFEWFSDSVGDYDKDGDIDQADVQNWLKPDVGTNPQKPDLGQKPGAPANSQITGEQNRPLNISLFDFDLDLGQVNGMVITDLPQDGKLQFKDNGQWKPVEENQEFSLLQLNQGVLRFVPDRNESGIDGDPNGVGDGKSDYAQFKYAGTVDGKPVTGDSTMSVDIKPAPPVVSQLEGFEDTPIKMSLLDFKLDTRAHDGVQISRLPDDGQLQIVKNGVWVPVQQDEVISVQTLNNQQIRFIPDPGENGMDGMEEGIGNGKSDYAQFQFVGTINGVQNGTPGTISIDLEPVDTLQGKQGHPLPISILDLDIDFRKSDGIQINAVPADGTLQVNDNGQWVDVKANDTVSLRAIDNDQLRFVPDKGEFGQDGFPPGIGNGKSTYAQFQYTAVANNEAIDKTRSVNIDIAPYELTANDKTVIDFVENRGNRWLLNHGGYRHQGADYLVTSGPLKGCTLVHTGNHHYQVFNDAGVELTDYKNPFNGKMASPVALDLNNDGKIGTTGLSTAQDRNNGTEIGQTVQFDIDYDGKMDTIEWMTGDGDGLLTDEQGRLFGDEGGKYESGYEKLALRDTNEDGQLTGNELNGLQVWKDDGDAIQEEGEMVNARDMGISQIDVDFNMVENERGEDLMRSNAVINGENVMTEDVWFGKEEAEEK